MDESPKQSSSMGWLVPVTMVVVIGAVVVGWFMFLQDQVQPAPRPNDSKVVKKKLTREESVELLALRDRAIGELENNEFDRAEALLLQIIHQLPEDPFGHRNLAICRDLAVEKLDPTKDVAAASKRPAAIKKAQEAADQLLAAEPKSHVPHILLARVALKQDDPSRATAALREAVQIAPKFAPAWYDLFLLEPLSPDEAPSKQTVEALRTVRELEPENLFVLKDWLPLQTQLKADDLAKTVAQSREIIEPFADVIKTNTRADILAFLTRLEQAVEAKQWSQAETMARTVRNVVLLEASRDERYVKWNSLEYMLLDYGPSFYERADLPDVTSAKIPVSFVSGKRPLGLPAGARAMLAVDFEFDGIMDGAALAQDQLVIMIPLAVALVDDRPTPMTLEIGEGFSGLVAADVDDDIERDLVPRLKKETLADLDLIAFGAAGCKFFENQVQRPSGERRFVEKNVGEGLAALRDVRAVVPADLDLDGDLDFLTMTTHGVQMWSNRGNWTFEDITNRSKLPSDNLDLTAAVAVDWDRDTDIDILVATTEGLGLLENLHHGRFRWRPLEGDFNRVKGATSLLVEQLGPHPSWSVIGAGPGGIHAVVTLTSSAGVVSSASVIAISDSAASSAASLDFDNDGFRDLLAIVDSKPRLWRGLPDGRFEVAAIDPGVVPQSITALTTGNIDQDGDEDLLLSSTGESKWLSNEGGNVNGWLNTILVSQHIKPSEQNHNRRVNKLGIGSMIEVRAGVRYMAQVVHQSKTHFGLGPSKRAEVMRVLWGNGLPQNVVAPEPDQTIFEEQILLGSCPYLYTWDGEKFAFYTDLLWNAPLGLKLAEDVVAPWREWEFLKIDGDKLRPKEGHYPLRITAELWEIEYFDQVKLYAVDHPAGTQIFTNEKVGPESLAVHKIHTVTTPRAPVAARDQHGNDILDQVKTRDGVYTRCFDRKLAQGLTTEHYLELDLGEWPGPVAANREAGKSSVVTLFLTGWMYPGSTSLRVQHSQNPNLKQSQPPALHAVDGAGQWREVRPFMGFPGGKTKTIAVDISDVFPPDSTDHRLRIVTNMEFYWDCAFFTIDDQPIEVRQTELALANAKLVDRGGVSLHSWPISGNGPDQFDYQQLVPGDAWPPIEGAFTRFGDILPLVTERDDQLVVMHPGDEMQLDFAVPSEPVPEGWVRDFVIYNVGWDKDCDQNTVYGESSEPLPFQAMRWYPDLDGQARPKDDTYVHYLKTYQTRTRPRGPFWNKFIRK